MDIVICCSQAIGGKILDTLLNPMSRQIGYLVHYKENVQTLEAELGKLVVEIRAVQQRVNEAQDNAKEIEEKVQNWLTEVDKMKGEVEEFLEGKDRAFRRCFKVRFPDLYSRHRLGREAKKKTEVITRLITDGKFETVSRPKPLPDIGIPHVLDYVHFKSRGRVFEEIIEALRDDTINVIGIYGIGGVGKTTMVEEVREQVKKDKHFDEVTWAVISQNLDVRKTQGQIAGRLSLDLDEAKDEVGRAGLLYNRLTDGRKILIILDDVWEKLNLKEIIGIPSMDSVKGCKILLTSRSREVCVKNNCRDPFLLGDLSEEEAWDLFKKEVGDSVDNAQIQPVAKKVCEQCGRLPLVVRVVGATLKNKNKPAWDDALEQLRNFAPEDIAGIDRKAFSSLEWSYNRLEHEDARSCFLLCSLFPEDANILIDDLARYAMVMGWLKHADTLEKANNRVRQLVEILKYSCLLLGGGLSYEEEAVRMHDIIRDIAIKIASRDEYAYLVKTGGRRWQTGSFERKKAISLTSNEIEELPGDLNCPELNTLFLECSHPSLIFPDSFFNGMEKLKVLHLRQIHTSSLPSSLLKLVNLRMLCLNNCEIEDISIIMELKKLEILILGGPDIVKVLPLDIRNLTLLRSLDLRNCRNFRGIELDVITSLTRLEELYISAWQDEWEAKAMNSNRKNASIPELNKLTDLTALGIHIPNTTSWLVDHPFDKLNRYKISIGTPFNFIDSLNSLSSCRALKLVDVPIRAGVKILMEKSEVLILHNLKGVKRSFSEEDGEGGFSTDLKYLEIDNCGDRENLWGYKQLLVAMGSFCKLSKLVVKSMHGLKYLFSPSIARGLMQLKELHIRECVRMETIIGNEGEEDEEKVIFHGLKFLLMDKLPRFGSFDLERMTSEGNSTCTATQPLFNHKIAFPVLEYLDIRSLNMKEIWDSQLPKEKSFSQLSTLQVSNCDNLVNIVPSHMLPRLRNLVEIEVESCDSVISVGLNAEEGFVASMPILPQLKQLRLHNLPKLMHYELNQVSYGNCCYPNLMKIVISSCQSLRNVFSLSVAINIVHLEKLKVSSCEKMQEIIATKRGSKETLDKIVFPRLKLMKLERLQNLKSFWSSESQEEERVEKVDLAPFELQSLFNDKIAFPVLEDLRISGLKIIKEIWDSQLLEENSFSQLRTLRILYCRNLVNIVPSHMLPRLRNLVEIEVESCDSVISVGLNAEEGFVASMPILPQLKQLRLHNLPKLMHYELNQVSYGNCCYPNLMKIVISSCQSLRNVFSLSVAINIVHLEELEVSSCEKMKEIIATRRGSKETLDKIVFPRLKLMKLERLQNLKSFWSSESQEEERVEKVDLAPSELQSLFNDKIAFPVLEDLRISGLKIIKEIWDSQLLEENSFSQLRTLRVLYCRNLVNIVPSHMLPRLRNLVEIEVESCDSVISVGLNAEEGFVASMQILPQLKQLRLHNLPKLMHYELNQVSYGNCCYPKLMKIVISSCQSLRNVFSLSVAINIVHLEELEVSSCEKMKEIIATRRGSKETLDKIVFPRLKLMKLERLQNLKSFWSSESQEEERVEKVDLAPFELQYLFNDKIAFPVLEDLRISGLKIIKEIWDSQLQEENSFSQLRTLRILYCRNLVNIVPSHMLPRLRNLVEIEVESCDSVISVGLNAEEGFVASMPILPQLKQLRLHNLPKLMHYELNQVSYGNCCYPNLMKIVISSCQSLRNVFSLSVAINIVHLEELEVSSCEKMQEIIATRRGSKETLDKIVFPRLKLMKLERLQNLKSFWSSESQEEERVEKVDLAPFELQSLFNDKVAFPNLEELYIIDTKLKLNNKWHTALTSESFSKLRVLVVEISGKPLSFGPLNLLQRLGNLQELEIRKCDSLEEVFKAEEEETSMKIREKHEHTKREEETTLVFHQLKIMRFKHLPHLRSFYSGSCILEFPSLKELWIEGCKKLKTIFSTINAPTQHFFNKTVAFPSLEKLYVKGMDELNNKWYTALPTKSFSKLRVLVVESCGKLLSFGPLNLLQRLENLQELEISKCDSLEEVFKVEEEETSMKIREKHEHTKREEETTLVFHQLKIMRFKYLPYLRSFYSGSCILEFPSLKELRIECCEKLETIFPTINGPTQHFFNEKVVFPELKKLYLISLFNLREIGIGSLPLHFIQILEVQNCGNLRNLFSSSIATTLERIEALSIASCKVMEEIVASDGVEEVINQIVLPQLQYLVLSNLPNLTRFCNTNYALNFPSLRMAWLEGCMKMQAFAFGQLTMPEIEIHGSHGELPWMGDLNVYVEQKVLKGEGLAVEEEEDDDA